MSDAEGESRVDRAEPAAYDNEEVPNEDVVERKMSEERNESLEGQRGSISYADEEEEAKDYSYRDLHDNDSLGSYDSARQTGTNWISLVDPPEFLSAQANFGHTERQTLRFFLEEYLKMCWDVGQTPVPQMFFLFQSRNKKHLLKRIKYKQALFYFPGNDTAARSRRLNDLDLNVLCAFLLKFFKGNLVNLDFRYNELKDIPALANLITESCSVKQLNLMSNSLSDNGIFTLKDALLRSQTLVYLCLAGCKLSPTASREVASLLKNLPTLRYLNLNSCGLKIEALITLLGTLREESCKLEALDLTGPNLPDFAAHEVFISMCTEMLDCNKHLVELRLGKAGIDDFDLETLMLGLLRNKTLRYLDLHSNKLNRDGARLLMEYLIKNRTLEVLDIDSNHVSNEGAEYLANAIYEKSALTTLSMRHCGLDDEGVRFLSIGIWNGTLQRLNVWQGTTISGKGSEAFGCLLQFGRLQPDNLDVTFYEVDGVWSMAQYGEGLRSLRRWDVYMPRSGPYSHQSCYDGFVQPHPRPYYAIDS